MFNKICAFQNLHLAYLKARKCKRYRKYILEFSYNLEKNLLKVQQELTNQTYKHGGYREFIVCDSKKRKIKAAPFRDRVIHHALYNVIEPIFDKGFIFDSFACRKEKGTHKAIKRLEKFIKSANATQRERERERENLPARHSDRAHKALCAREESRVNSNTMRPFGLRPQGDNNGVYCLQCDVSKYFDSINHQILFDLIKKKITDKKVLWLIKEILNSSYEREINRGIPIGNLTSQLFANIYLNELDQFVKHRLRLKYYLRYMDDFLILRCNKRKLHQIKEEIREFLQEKLELKLHPKKVNIFPVDGGIDFLGYRIFENYRLLRKSTVKRFVKRTKVYQKRLNQGQMTQEKFNNSLQSWLAYARHANSRRLRKNIFEKFEFEDKNTGYF